MSTDPTPRVEQWMQDASEGAQLKIWEDLCDRQGFGLDALPTEIYEEVRNAHRKIIAKYIARHAPKEPEGELLYSADGSLSVEDAVKGVLDLFPSSNRQALQCLAELMAKPAKEPSAARGDCGACNGRGWNPDALGGDPIPCAMCQDDAAQGKGAKG